MHPANILFVIAYLGLSILTLALPVYTGWLGWTVWKSRKQSQAETTG